MKRNSARTVLLLLIVLVFMMLACEFSRAEPRGKELRQWAITASASSEATSPDRPAVQATGEPDTPTCGSHPTAWAPATSTSAEWLAIGFDTIVLPTQINIYESNAPGSIIKVEGGDQWGYFYTVWEGVPQKTSECPHVLSIPITNKNRQYNISAVRITIQQEESGPQEEIDAVELVGLINVLPFP